MGLPQHQQLPAALSHPMWRWPCSWRPWCWPPCSRPGWQSAGRCVCSQGSTGRSGQGRAVSSGDSDGGEEQQPREGRQSRLARALYLHAEQAAHAAERGAAPRLLGARRLPAGGGAPAALAPASLQAGGEVGRTEEVAARRTRAAMALCHLRSAAPNLPPRTRPSSSSSSGSAGATGWGAARRSRRRSAGASSSSCSRPASSPLSTSVMMGREGGCGAWGWLAGHWLVGRWLGCMRERRSCCLRGGATSSRSGPSGRLPGLSPALLVTARAIACAGNSTVWWMPAGWAVIMPRIPPPTHPPTSCRWRAPARGAGWPPPPPPHSTPRPRWWQSGHPAPAQPGRQAAG